MESHRGAHDVAGSLAEVLGTRSSKSRGSRSRDRIDLVLAECVRDHEDPIAMEGGELLVAEDHVVQISCRSAQMDCCRRVGSAAQYANAFMTSSSGDICAPRCLAEM